jgi:hypothetical protein
MSLEELRNYPRDWLTCEQVAPVLGTKRANLHDQAVTDPAALGFPVIVVKSRVKIPRLPFIRFMTEGRL